MILGTPDPLRELGLAGSLEAAHQRVRDAVGVREGRARVHLDLPRWFHAREEVPALPVIATALQTGRRVVFGYRHPRRRSVVARAVDPWGLVDKAGLWYLVGAESGRTTVFRVARIEDVDLLDDRYEIPAEFDLAEFWRTWSDEFQRSLPRIEVIVRASPRALRALPEILGDAAKPAIDAASPPDTRGWRTVTLTFEHVGAAAYALAGFGDLIDVVNEDVREAIITNARATLVAYSSR